MAVRIVLLAVVGLLVLSVPAFAADDETAAAGGDDQVIKPVEAPRWFGDKGAAWLGAGIGAGIVIMGGGASIGRIGSSAAEAMARQPEAAGSINGVALILAAMIEGATLFAVVVCLMGVLK